MLGPGNLAFNANQGILFLVGGAAQVFWTIPMMRKWGTPWGLAAPLCSWRCG